jgi:hypothetical protein
MVRKFVGGFGSQTSKDVVVCCTRHHVISLMMLGVLLVAGWWLGPWIHNHVPSSTLPLVTVVVPVVAVFLVVQLMKLYMRAANRSH